MLNGLIPLPWFLRKRVEPKIYHLECTKCGYAEDVEISAPDAVVAYHDPDTPPEPRQVDELPLVCPKCGGKLKKTKIPVMLRY